ncbi:DUF4097 family beta strand repeat-containing protein [Streptosporangium sp. NPDC050855]|uniref:DUF4097 family beta strand repeat-containing protein n=1 Tax=Streptosporangium sp. NPDC050855 TaxID=3366194 RepID=UPI0037A96B72
MPTFDTPEPIHAVIELMTADVRIHAGDRTDTVVEIRPKDGLDDTGAQGAEQIRVEYSRGRLLVKAPAPTLRSWFRWSGSVEVTVELPEGSRVDAKTTGDFHCEGRLGDSRFETADGDIWLDRTGRLRLNTADGDVTVVRSAGHTDVTTANGEIRIHEIDGAAVIRTANGSITLGEVTGDLRLKTAYGDITVDRALAGVDARTATGNVRVGEVTRGPIVLETTSGEIEAGIREGTAVLLDARTDHGTVNVLLDPSDGPRRGDETAQLRARTSDGDIVIRRTPG